MTLPPSGIYKITNNKNGKVYIGQSQNIYARKKQHFVALQNGNHENKGMQAEWRRDSKGFRWEVIEFCPLDKLNEREKYWIEKYNSIEEGYNAGWVPYKRKQPKKPAYKQKSYHRSS